MAKMPFFQFYPSDWIRDTRSLSADTKGAWIDILAIAWNEPERGVYTRYKDMMMRELGIDPDNFESILAELDLVADVKEEESSGIITVVSRRMVKEEKDREMNRNRQLTFRHNAGITKKYRNVTPKKSEVRSQKSEITTPPIAPHRGAASKVMEWFERTWWQYPRERRVGKKAALRSYRSLVKTHDDALWVARALDNYLKSKTVQDGFVKNASTFFANVEDYADERRNSTGTNGQTHIPGTTPDVSENGIEPTVKQVVSGLGHRIPIGTSDEGTHH